MITGDPPKQKRSQGNEKKTEDDNITQGPSKRRKQFRVGDDGKILFDEEELKMILDFKRGEDYIEVLCGATNKKYGDYVGRLKINNEGQYFITCECCLECPLVSVTLEAFEKHALREGSGRRRQSSTLENTSDKVLLHQANVANRKDSAMRKQNFHRDEFLRCTRCGKERRFHLQSRPDIKNYHDALNNKCWTCSLWPYQKITCDDDEERSSLKASRGCSRSSTCQGCSTCYCEGKLRFLHRFTESNDVEYGNFYISGDVGTAVDLPGFMESLVKQMSVNLKRIHSLGIKKVAVGLLQPIGCLPVLNVISFRTNCIGLLNVISKDHNKMLLKAVQELNKEAADKSVFMTLDLYNSFLSAIETMQKKRAEKSTLMNPLQPCCEGNNLEDSCGSVDDEGSKKYSLCENPKLSFFWDTLHPSQNGWFAVYTQ
ncbi:Protein ULTRAPETALA 2 [Glycine max]|nr:Protein ULTRAPETALA 2 [Glycine max]